MTQANKLGQSDGLEITLKDDFQATELPEWRLAAFSLILPFPLNGLPLDFDLTTFADLAAAAGDDAWAHGRSKGIKSIENPDFDHASGTFQRPAESNPPRAYYHDADYRFIGPMADSFGARSVDWDLFLAGKKRMHGRHAPIPSPGVRAHHYRFDREIGRTEFVVRDYDFGTRSDITAETGEATVRLDSAEYLQYHDGYFTRIVHADLPGELLVQHFLMLNVIAENVTARTLNNLSRALYRPRNGIPIQGGSEVKILQHFSALAIDQLDRTFQKLGYGPVDAEMTAGSFLRLPKRKEDRIAQKRARDMHKEGVVVSKTANPQRAVVAVPHERVCADASDADSSDAAVPIPDELARSVDGTAWAWHQQWAWQLASGADMYAEVIPQQTDEVRQASQCGYLDAWTIWSSAEGLAVVRKKPASGEGARYWSLATTRYPDLIILQMRAYAALQVLSQSLAQMRTTRDAASIEDTQSFDLDQRFALIGDALRKLEAVQLDFVHFRDRLWFTYVPRREIDTEILRRAADALGNDDSYQDFLDELQLRQEIYNTQHSRLRVERNQLAQQRAEREEQEQAKRDREAEEKAALEEKQESRRANGQNVILGVVAAALGGPAWAEATDHANELGPAVLATVVILMIVGLILWAVNAYFKRGRYEKEAPGGNPGH